MTVTAAAFIVGAYLLGAIPSSYLMARWLKGVDIRTTGSGNVGASNLSEHVGRWIGIPVGFFDLIVKATVPILLAQFLDQGLTVQAAVGLAAVLGHNWSPYLQMTGGRGVSTVIGIMLAFLMWQEIVIALVLVGLVGTLWLKDMAFWMFVMIVALPVMMYFFDFFDLFDRDTDSRHPLRLSRNRTAGKAPDRQLGAPGAGLQLEGLPLSRPLGPRCPAAGGVDAQGN